MADTAHTRPYQRKHGRGYAGGAGATPLAGSGNRLGCLGADICGAENAGLAGFGVGFFGACGLYGGSAENVWGNASGVWLYGETAIPYGEAVHVWGGRGIAWGTKVA